MTADLLKMRTMLIALAMFVMCGCSNTVSSDNFSNIQKRLLELKSYKCTVHIKIFSNKNTTQYIANQFYAFPSKYRTEILSPESLKGCVTISSGKGVVISNPNADACKQYRYENVSNVSGDNTSLTEFFGNYVKSEQSKMVIKNGKYVLSTEISGGNAYLDTETLTLNASGQPEKLEIYDRNGRLKWALTYSEFQMNPKIDEKIFEVH